MVYLLDPNTATAGSVDHTYLAQSIAERYPNVRLAQIPSRHREAREEFPFALLDARTGEVVKHLRESETNISFVYRWLYEHDTQARGVKEVYAKYLADKEKAKKEKENNNKGKGKEKNKGKKDKDDEDEDEDEDDENEDDEDE